MYIKQALLGKNDWWRTLLILLICLAPLLINLLYFLVLSPEELDAMFRKTQLFKNKNLNLILNLVGFVFFLGIFFALFLLLHKRNLLNLTTSRKKIDFKRIFFSFSILFMMQIAVFGISYLNNSSNITWNYNPSQFWILVIIAILLLPIQIGFEEYIFRGYLQQQIGNYFNNKWLALIISGILFGVVHSANPEVSQIGFKMMIFYIGTGLLLGYITLLDQGLELSIGFHFANNLIACLLVTTDYSALQTEALFKYVGDIDKTELFTQTFIEMTLVYSIFFFILAKVYKWKNWKLRFTNTIE
ncbi:MAG: type II CAAX endopeptidase family protein [Bacteroidota bacterium]|nr:type II CAAX endopeptidase family protein [Bacteroidota bacterium]